MKLTVYIVLINIICSFSFLTGQEELTDSLSITIDSTLIISNPNDSLADSNIILSDTIPQVVISEELSYKLSKDAFSDKISYGSKDSSILNLNSKLIQLYDTAYVDYEGNKLAAGYISIDLDKKEAHATYTEDNKKQVQKPTFSDGNQDLAAGELRYNFETKKGLGYHSRMKESEFDIHGEKTKFVSAASDSTTMEDRIFQKNARITTCDHEHPHYSIRTKKIKVIPNKLAVMGVSQLEIMGVPTPLILPFGMFPLVEGQSAGLIFPANYEYNETLGFGLLGIGYYFPINDYFDLTLTGDIYTRGTHRVRMSSNFKKRYKYSGVVNLEYANNIGESPIDGSRTSTPSFSLTVNRSQDAKAHPYKTFGGSIQIQSGEHQSTNYNDYNSQVRNILTSNFSFRNTLPWSPFSYSVGMDHTQNTLLGTFDMTLPRVTLDMQTIYPFKNKNKISNDESWYEKINVRYSADFKNYVSTTDSTIFTQETVDKLVTGLQQEASTSASFTMLKYFNITPRASYQQIATLKTLNRELDPEFTLDTIGYLITQNNDTIPETMKNYDVVDDYEYGFKTFHKVNAGIDLSTQIFGTKRWSKGWLRGIRHTMKPTIGLNYVSGTDQYYQEVDTSLDPTQEEEIRYNPFQGGAFNTSLGEKQLGVTYGISNFFEGKYFSKKTKEEKKFKLLRQLNLNGSYNYAADSLQFSPVNIVANTDFFNGITSVRLDARYDFYKYEDNTRINKTVWEEDGRLLEFNRFNATITNRFTVANLITLFKGDGKDKPKASERKTDRSRVIPDKPENLLDDTNDKRAIDDVKKDTYRFTLMDYIQNFTVNYSWKYSVQRLDGRDTSYTSSHTIGIRGSFPLTDNWNINIDNISYDLARKSFVYPSLSLERDLHCWSMSFNWQPSREVYGFYIGVKSTSLSFLKYDYGQRNSGVLTR